MKTQASSRTHSGIVVPFGDIGLADLPRVGGKNASLGEMVRELGAAGGRVPGGFALTVDAFFRHLGGAGLEDVIYDELDALDVSDTHALTECARSIRRRIIDAPLPDEVWAELHVAYRALGKECGRNDVDVAVRSSATAEDLPTASFAGQHETFLNVRGERELGDAVRRCMASLFTDRAIVYRENNEILHRGVGLSVGVQRMVRSDLGSAGVIFTLDTESGNRDVVLITGAWGLGETVVQGRVDPDEYLVHKATAREGFRPILRKSAGDKRLKLVYAGKGAKRLKEVRVAGVDRHRLTLSDDDVLLLTKWGMSIEEHYSGLASRGAGGVPMDIEWAKDGKTDELFILQARPETVHAQSAARIEVYSLRDQTVARTVLARGKAVGGGIGVGGVRVVRSAAELHGFEAGEVLVAEMTDPDWEPVLKKAAGVVTDHGGRTCHAAIVSRELGIPCVVGAGDATTALRDGQTVSVSCVEGEEGRVYDGVLEYDHKEIDPRALPTPRVPLMLNLANPERALHLAAYPAAGVGLLRIEFLIANEIGVHPMALVHPERVESVRERKRIDKLTAEYDRPADFFVDKLSQGVAQIAGPFYPRPVIMRFSDFKTNEYAGLLGGKAFETTESNPMLGFRGASRYYDERYREGFALECGVVRRVREEMGLTNLKVMIPFCRTIGEGEAVLRELAANGLERGNNGFEVWVMCEIPNNVIQAEAFSELFDGFSIGSNDLTQLTLGIDRDSEILAPLFNERDAGVKALIEMVIERAHKNRRRVGICGEAPSNYPEFAEWLAMNGIDSISLNADAFFQMTELLADRSQPRVDDDL